MIADPAMETVLLPAADEGAVTRAARLLAAGQIVALPTETVYGLAADAAQPEAVAAVFQAKERPFFDPLIVHLPGAEWLDRLTQPSRGERALADRLAAAFWPGPLTMLLPRRPEAVPDIVTAGSPLVAVRMSAHPVFQAVLAELGRPVAAPSANRFGRISPTTGEHVRSELAGRVPLILEAGPTRHGLESTIVALEDSGRALRILRPGPVTAEMLGRFAPVTTGGPAHGQAAAPGQLPGHYAPRTPLRFHAPRGAGAAGWPGERLGLLAFRADAPRKNGSYEATAALSQSGDLREAAANLFAALRTLDAAGLDLIVAEPVPETGLGVAIMERLRRAAVGSGQIFAWESVPGPYVADVPSVEPPGLIGEPPASAPSAAVDNAAATKFPSGGGSTRAAGVVGLAVMCSRVLGLARDQIFAGLFGAGAGMDAFLTAFRAPNLLRDLFAEGALSTAFVTTFSKKIQLEGDGAAWRLANKMATLTVVFMSLVTLLGIALSPQLIEVLGGGFHAVPGKFELTVQLTRIMYPFILLVSLAALLMGMLNAKHVFGAPAMASSFFNLGSIVGGVGVGYYLDPHFGTRALFGMAGGTLLGGFLQFVVQVPSLGRAGYRFRPDFGWRDDGVRAILRLMGPAVIAASAVQVNVMVNASFASHQGNGAVTWLNNSFRLMQLPLGVFGVAIATVTLPLVSKSAALGDDAAFRATLARALRLAFFLTIPSAIGLMCLGGPIISLLYQHGRFTAEAARQTGAALQFYAIGLAAYSGIKVLAPAFYALDARTTPMTVSFVAIGINVLLNGVFTYWLGWGHRGLAFSTSLTAVVNFSLLYWLMQRRMGRLETRRMAATLARLAAAGAVLAAVCLAGQRYVLGDFYRLGIARKCLTLFSVIGAGAAAFFAVCHVLRLEEMREAAGIFGRRLRRGRRG